MPPTRYILRLMVDVMILDGGMGKELRRIGAPFRQPEWSSLALIEAPDMVAQAHRNFIEAGARTIITNNYAVVPYHHTDEFFGERGVELVTLSGQLARDVAESARTEFDAEVLVAGSMPPLFGSYEPDNFDAGRATPLYRTIARSLDPFVDHWVGETLSTIAEMDTIVDAIATVDATKPVWMAFSLPDQWHVEHGMAIRSGENIASLAAAVAKHDRITAVLFNCSIPEQTGPALNELRRALDELGLTHIRTGGYANAFPTARTDSYQANEVIFERRDELTGDRYADVVAEWIDGGATIVGGCCDMYPEHIAALATRFG